MKTCRISAYLAFCMSLSLSVPVSLDEAPGYIDAVEGDMVTFHCKAYGQPQPQYHFYKAGSLMNSYNGVEMNRRVTSQF